MSKDKLGQEPVFPMVNSDRFPRLVKQNDIFLDKDYSNGMSKRFYAACCATQGLCADPNIILSGDSLIVNVRTAYEVADELLKQENE